jgi:predicted dehydrogenase
MSIAECWDIINTSESTRKHCMMLENCCYDFFEMTALNMAQQGLFGEILHVEGAYIHNLDPYWKLYQGNWRLDFNQKHRGDNYPTHGLGPACQVLNIHRGDRMEYLVSMDTKSVHGQEVSKEIMGTEEFASGDHTVTLIRTVGGKQIEIQHNVFTRRPYNRMYQITGTEGFANKYPVRGFALMSHNLPEGREEYAGLDGELGMKWDQIFMGDDKTPTDLYGITGIPQIILFGPDGTIVKRNLRGEELVKTLEEVLK